MASSRLPFSPLSTWRQLLLRDVGVWLAMLTLVMVSDKTFAAGTFQWGYFGQFLGWLALPAAAAIYGNHLVLVPRFFDQGRYWPYAAAVLVWAALLGAGLALTGSSFYRADPWYRLALNMLFVMLLAMAFLMSWRAVAARQQRLHRTLLEREQQLRLLEAQVNPHFLFNTLNSLYALSLSGSPRTPDMILELAQLMRYQLESTRQPAVPLAEELDYLRAYARLQELRLGPRCPVRLTLPEPAAAEGLRVPPLLFLALVENAFTYGTRRAQGSFVEMTCTLNGRRLHLHLRNALPPPTDAVAGAGTGLPNTRQRLALLFPDRHQLQTGPVPAAHHYLTNLTLDL